MCVLLRAKQKYNLISGAVMRNNYNNSVAENDLVNMCFANFFFVSV